MVTTQKLQSSDQAFVRKIAMNLISFLFSLDLGRIVYCFN